MEEDETLMKEGEGGSLPIAQEKAQSQRMETAELSEDEQQQRTAAQLRAMAVSVQQQQAVCSNGGGGGGAGSDEGGSSSVGGGSYCGRARPGDKRSETDSPCGAPTGTGKFEAKRNKPFVKNSTKFDFSGGSGSGDQDGMVTTEDGVDVTAKKRKTRRGKPKHRKLKPYSKQHSQPPQQQQQTSYQQRSRGGRPTSGRCCHLNAKNSSGRYLSAPVNTTQFLMEDHNDLPELDQRFAHEIHQPDAQQPVPPPMRTRDSSFSVDSDEDFFYSSPEDEEEFLTREFSTAYEDLHAERLMQLSKTELIQEYIQLEAKCEGLTKRLKSARHQQTQSEANEASKRQLKIYQQKIDELVQQNEQLHKENEMLKQQQGRSSPVSSVDSESDSSTTSTGTDCSGHSRKSPVSSPMPSSYNQKTCNRKNATSISSFDNESDCKTSEEEGNKVIASPNGHAASIELIEMPT